MKYLLLFIPFILNAWTFTEKDFNNLDWSQKTVISAFYHKGLATNDQYTMAAIPIVENMARMKDNNKNHICGPGQKDINFTKYSCHTLETNLNIAAIVALKDLHFWEYRTYYNSTTGLKFEVKRSWRDKMQRYNLGYTSHPHGPIYVAKIAKVVRLLQRINYKG